MMEDHTIKKDLTLKLLLLTLLVTLIGLVGFGLWSSLRPIVIYQNYRIDLTPGKTYHVGDNVPYVASGTKLQHIDGTVTHYMDCTSVGDTANVIIRLSQVPTNSLFGNYMLHNQSPTGGAATYTQLKLPATCFLRNVVTFKPAPLHPDVTYTAQSMHGGILSTFTLTK
jgi:hypothetical protein